MKSMLQWFMTMSAGLMFTGAASADHVISTGTVKSVDADAKEFVLTDSDGKDWNYKFGKKIVINRGGKEGANDLKADDVVNICHDKGKLTTTANYILVNEGTTKDCKLVHGKFKKYDATTKEFTNTEAGNKDKTYPMGDAKVRLNMKKSEIADIKVGDMTLAIIKTVGETMSLNALMVTRKI